MIYCLRQKKYTETKNEETIQTKNGRLIMKGICVECGAKKSKFVKSNIGGSFDIHSAIGKLPRPKNGFTPGKYKFMGPYNPLDKQLEYDREGNITKYHVKPYNEIDAISAQHDVDITLSVVMIHHVRIQLIERWFRVLIIYHIVRYRNGVCSLEQQSMQNRNWVWVHNQRLWVQKTTEAVE